MAESFRRDSEYDSISGHGHQTAHPEQHASFPPEERWPRPPAYDPAPPPATATGGHDGGNGNGTALLTPAAGPSPRRRATGRVAFLAAVASGLATATVSLRGL